MQFSCEAEMTNYPCMQLRLETHFQHCEDNP